MKRAAGTQAEPAPAADEARSPGNELPPAEDTRSDAEVLAELGLPEPETLQPGDDFTAFMARTVPARIRSRALRRLWLSNPVLSAIDEMVEYGEDYSDAATVIENLQTAYQVGRGFLDKVGDGDGDTQGERLGETPEEAVGAESDTADPEADPDLEDGLGGAPDWRGEAGPDAVAEAAPEAVTPAPEVRPLGSIRSPRRRMRFRLAEE